MRAVEISFLSELGCPLNHSLNRLKPAISPQILEQQQPFTRINRILKQACAADALSAHGLHKIGGKTIFLELRHHALAQQLSKIIGKRSRVELKRWEQPCPVVCCFAQESLQRQAPATIPEDLNDPVASTAKRIRIGRARRALTFGENAEQKLQALRQRQQGTGIA